MTKYEEMVFEITKVFLKHNTKSALENAREILKLETPTCRLAIVYKPEHTKYPEPNIEDDYTEYIKCQEAMIVARAIQEVKPE